MDGEQLKGTAEIVQSVMWPAIVIVVLLRFGNSVSQFIDKMTEFTVKGGGGELTAKRQAEVAAALATAEVKASANPEGTMVMADTSAEIAKAVSAVTPRTIQKLSDSTVLWVDDNPNNNIDERRALEASGIKIVTSLSTDNALEMVKRQNFDAIISDMTRGSDRKAGITLLQKLNEARVRVPFIVYSSNGSSVVRQAAAEVGLSVWGATNRPSELVQLVTGALQNTKA